MIEINYKNFKIFNFEIHLNKDYHFLYPKDVFYYLNPYISLSQSPKSLQVYHILILNRIIFFECLNLQNNLYI